MLRRQSRDTNQNEKHILRQPILSVSYQFKLHVPDECL